jgi:hypothetical protein
MTAARSMVTIVSAVTIRDLRDGKVLYDNQNLCFAIRLNSHKIALFFNEEDPAVGMARAFANPSFLLSSMVWA